jgi:hypothetical protein
VLTEGYQFSSTTGLARMLLSSPPCTVLVALGDHISYEIAVGLNGVSHVVGMFVRLRVPKSGVSVCCGK